jgi:hypothetical protein
LVVKIWLDCHKFKKFPCLIMPMSTKCQKNEKKMTINAIQHDDVLCIYDCFTEWPWRQNLLLVTVHMKRKEDGGLKSVGKSENWQIYRKSDRIDNSVRSRPDLTFHLSNSTVLPLVFFMSIAVLVDLRYVNRLYLGRNRFIHFPCCVVASVSKCDLGQLLFRYLYC